MAVFTDEIAARNITLGNTADWTVNAASMPNGDPSVSGDGSIATSYYVGGDAWHMGNGSPWSSEMWIYATSYTAALQLIAINSNVGATAIAWYWALFNDATMRFVLFNTGVRTYMSRSTPALTNATWNHVVVTKAAGADLRLYLNGAPISSTTSASGTPQAPSSSYRLFLGTHGDGGNSMGASSSGVRIAKFAMYQSVLTPARVNSHYLSMAAT